MCIRDRYKAPYVPGWDTHGLPIELKARAKAGVENSATISPLELRKICREYALTYVDNQREQFKRLGVLGEWDNPYLTLKPEFEAKQIEIFGEMCIRDRWMRIRLCRPWRQLPRSPPKSR